MRKTFQRMTAFLLASLLALGLSVTAFAAEEPSFNEWVPFEYWALQDEYVAADAAKDLQGVVNVVGKIYDLLMPLGISGNLCRTLESKCELASWCCEVLGDIDGAILWMERQKPLTEWYVQNLDASYQDKIINMPYRLAYLNAARTPKIYALVDGVTSPYSYGPSSGTWYGSVASGSQTGESAVLIYISNFYDSESLSNPAYWVDYQIRTNEKVASAAQNGGVIEVALNFWPESTAGVQKILDDSDAHIAGLMSYLGGLNANILLRIGAEMDSWHECDADTYIQAFRRVASAAHQYGNIKTVFSPNHTSNREMPFSSFYPGDEYVDWIGVSNYHSTNYESRRGGTGVYAYDYAHPDNDAYYGVGIYDSDPLIILTALAAFADAHGKPMMISEGGSGYGYAGDTRTPYAVDQVNKIYSYVNMIYPQVKAVFYFDTDVDTDNFALAGNPEIENAYKSAISKNGGYLAEGQASAPTWQELSQVTPGAYIRQIAVYASFPGNNSATVQYYVDGEATSYRNTVPYTVDASILSAGKHTIRAEVTCGQFNVSTQEYEITITEAPQTGFQLSSAASWAQPIVQQAHDLQLLTERTENNFTSQISRLQFADLAVTLAERVTGQTIPTVSADTFTDSSDTAVLKANYAGIANGKGDGKFAPNDPITRQEICIMLSNVARYVDSVRGTSTLASAGEAPAFPDSADISSWALSDVNLMAANGIMTGKDGGTAAPLDNTSIQEAVIMVMRLYEKFN